MKTTLTVYPFFIHAFFLSVFASVIGPFGGFFASGFKRAFKIKASQEVTQVRILFLILLPVYSRTLATSSPAMAVSWIGSTASSSWPPSSTSTSTASYGRRRPRSSCNRSKKVTAYLELEHIEVSVYRRWDCEVIRWVDLEKGPAAILGKWNHRCPYEDRCKWDKTTVPAVNNDTFKSRG